MRSENGLKKNRGRTKGALELSVTAGENLKKTGHRDKENP